MTIEKCYDWISRWVIDIINIKNYRIKIMGKSKNMIIFKFWRIPVRTKTTIKIEAKREYT